MENRKTFTYNGVNSADYGLYISGDSVYNAPSRVYEMVDIAGRNGQLAIDQGRFENIEVTYPAFIFAETQTEFAQRLREIRAWLMSPVGYQRLEDTYHPDEFRMAIYMSGLEADPTHYSEAGEFELTFNCKPQRFLKSGEEKIVLGEWGETETITGDIATFEAESNTGIKSLVVDIEPIQSGTGDPSPSNVRPISGWSGVNVEQRGKNLFDPSAKTSPNNTNVYFWFNGGYKLPAGAYTISFKGNITLSGLYAIDRENNVNIAFIYSGNTLTFTIAEEKMVTINFYYARGFTDTSDNLFQLELGSTATAYEPYQGESKSIPFKDENGDPVTVYGGNMNITDGEGSNGMGIVDLGSLAWVKPFTDYSEFRSTGLTNFKTYSDSIVANACCSKYPILTANQTYRGTNTGLAISSYVSIGDSSYTDAATFKEAMSGVMLVYELATPTPIYCEPTEINTLDGVNNIWADTGDVSVEIGEDPNILVNPTPFEALPIFEVVGTGSLTVGNTTVTITGDSTQDIFIDSDIMEAYEDDNGAIISRNDRINLSGTDFPKLGEETRVEANGLTSVKITPKWWTI